MSDQINPEQQRAFETLTKSIAQQLAQGVNKEQIIKQIVKNGWEEATAREFVDNVENRFNEYKNSAEGRQMYMSKYKKMMITGVLWAIGGTVVSLISYNMVSNRGGTYYLFWGAVIFGLFDFVRGLIGWLKYKERDSNE